MKVLITGGAGFIGSNLAREIVKQHNALILDDFSGGDKSHIQDIDGLEVVEADLRKEIPDLKCDFIYHAAANPSVPLSIEKPLFDFGENMTATLNALELARKNNAPFVFFSSCTVYGGVKADAYSEDLALDPISIYGCSKLCGEKYVRAYNVIYKLPTIALRFFNVYGPYSGHGVMYDFFRKLSEDPYLEVLGTGRQVKDYVNIKDVVDILSRLMDMKQKLNGEAYNIGTGVGTSVMEIAETMRDIIAPKKEIKVKGGEAWKGDMPHAIADISKARLELGFEPGVSLKEGMKEYISWLEKTYKA